MNSSPPEYCGQDPRASSTGFCLKRLRRRRDKRAMLGVLPKSPREEICRAQPLVQTAAQAWQIRWQEERQARNKDSEQVIGFP